MNPSSSLGSVAFLAAASLALALPARAQGGDLPPSFTEPGLQPLAAVDLRDLPVVDTPKIASLDAAASSLRVTPLGLAMKADLDSVGSGTWETLPSGDLLWRLRVRAANALWIQPIFGSWRVPDGAKMWVYDPNGDGLQGPFTHDDESPQGVCPVDDMEGDTAVVELLWPGSEAGLPNLHLTRFVYGFRDPFDEIAAPCQGECNPDTQCDVGVDISVIKRGYVRYKTTLDICDNGSTNTIVTQCSGTMINTTANDCRQYVLTAGHCVSNAAHAYLFEFLFNFERPACCAGQAPSPGNRDVVTGATILAEWDGTPSGGAPIGCFNAIPNGNDMTLMRIDPEIPQSFNVRFNGWSRSGNAATGGLSVHMPTPGKGMKVAVTHDGYDKLASNDKFWRVDWEIGRTRGGSSGSPLFNQNLRVTGFLQGGPAESLNCPGQNDRFGRVGAAWTGGGNDQSRLSNWLDPTGFGGLSYPGREDAPEGPCQFLPWPGLIDSSFGGSDPFDAPGGGSGSPLVLPGRRLNVVLRNEGQDPMTNVRAALTTPTPGVRILDGTATWPDIPGHEMRSSADSGDGFLVQVRNSMPCGTPIEFDLMILSDDGDGAWTKHMTVRLGEPSTQALAVLDTFHQTSIEGSNAWQPDTADDTTLGPRWFIGDIPFRTDTVLTTAPIDLPSDCALRFRHRMDSEHSFDGGVLEIRDTAGGPTGGPSPWVDAEPHFRSGGYLAGISSDVNPDVNGRDAWSGDSDGWQDVEVDLSPFAGQTIELRWRFVSDDSGGDIGWWIDDAVIETTLYDDCRPDPIGDPEQREEVGAQPRR